MNQKTHDASAMSADARWCRRTFDSLVDRGRWAVPRSGLIFERRGTVLHLVSRMPFTDELSAAATAGRDVPADAAALRTYQDRDLALIRSRFEEAGLAIVDSTTVNSAASEGVLGGSR